ncbi:Ger(x)C family spore germination C-terminal domain-containing protein [Alicyclobacillus fodiniaquatilis]|uniref:Ger(X)C family spore germination C-terminal domain-containing protein n=1 Tax=Alicyclobacillus fodiniaquatilis TaxID=1661150 RepID=A0ABW4JBI1_9BACL
MNRKLSIVLKACWLAVAIQFLPGCFDYEKINDRAQIIGIGVDPVQGNPDLLSYTFQVPELGLGGGSSDQSSANPGPGAMGPNKNFTAQAHSVSEAIALAQLNYDKMFYLGNLECIVLNRQLNAHAIQHVVNELMSTRPVDKLAWILTTPDSARVVMNYQNGDEASAEMMDRWLGATISQYGHATRTRLWQFWRDTRLPGVQAHTGLVKIEDKNLVIYGMQTFHGNTPKLELTPTETLYYNFIEGRVKGLSMSIGEHTHLFDVRDVSCSSRQFVLQQGKRSTLGVRIRVKGILVTNISDRTESLSDRDLQRYEGMMAAEIQKKSYALIQKLQQHHLDSIGFGRTLLLSDPTVEPNIDTKWDEFFAQVKAKVTVEVQLKHKGEIV